MQQSQPVTATVNPTSNPASAGSPSEEAPPKQVALAMDRLGQAARIIADIRIGADRLLEALFIASQPHQSTKPLQLFHKEDDAMRRHLQDLRSLGRQLEESGVLNESLRSRSNSWGLHMPLVCPDGAVVAYAWKRQLAGQAGASAVDRTRLALKAFTDQKRRFFPHLDDGLLDSETPSKKHCGSEEVLLDCKDEVSNLSTLPDVLKRMEKEVPNLEILTFERLDWLKRASSLSSSQNENSLEHNFHGSNNLRPGSFGAGASDRIAVIELLFPSVFRAVVSLHPAGSIDPDAVAFFSPDEGGSYVHARGYSVYHVYRHITEYAATALQYFIGNQAETSLYCLLVMKLYFSKVSSITIMLGLVRSVAVPMCTGFSHLSGCLVAALDLQLPDPFYKVLQVGISFQVLWISISVIRILNLNLLPAACCLCSKCSLLLAMDKQSALLLPPVHRPYWQFSFSKLLSTIASKDQNTDITQAYHVGCSSAET